MVSDAEQLAREGKPHYIEVQGAQYEGTTVWFNTLIASAGGSILTPGSQHASLGPPAVEADNPKMFKHFKWAPYPEVVPGQRARVTVGGIDLAVSAYSPHQQLAFQAALCLRNRQNQLNLAIHGGLPPTLESLYHDPRMFPTTRSTPTSSRGSWPGACGPRRLAIKPSPPTSRT